MQAVLHLIRLEEGYSKCVVLLDKTSSMRDREYVTASRFAYYGPRSGEGKMKRDSRFNLGSGYNPSVACRYFPPQMKSSTDLN